MSQGFRLGFWNQRQETERLSLKPSSGEVPRWLSGSLVRTGPAIFDLPKRGYRHWFDGLAMLHKFAFDEGSAHYWGRFLQSPDYGRSVEAGQPKYDEFMTVPERGALERVQTLVDPERQFGRNGMVNIQTLGASSALALTESPLSVQFDLADLRTIGSFDYPDALSSVMDMITTAHPIYDAQRRTTYNFLVRLIPVEPKLIFTRLDDGATSRQVVGELTLDAVPYVHSFGMTENYLIFTEYPLHTHPAARFLMPLTGRGYIENFHWSAERGTRFHVVDKRNGLEVGTWETDAFFAFHHVHAEERGDELLVDMSVYENGPAILRQLSLDVLRGPEGGKIDFSSLFRFTIPLQRKAGIRSERLADPMFEMPSLNYERCGTSRYRFAYGVSFTRPGQFVDQLVKIDIDSAQCRFWHVDGCYPGEPVFVPRPGATREDDGVALSVVLDSNHDLSFLLVLDAATYEERARLTLPIHIPFMLHGRFLPGLQ